MRMLRVFLLLLFTPLTIVLHVGSLSSPFDITTVSSASSWNITTGSSISTSSKETGFWLSPSGIFAFGFYPLCHDCQGYKIGIWMPQSADKTVVWSLEVDDVKPVYGTSSSIVLNYDGVFMLSQAGSTMKPLFGAALGPASYALIHDTGNFVIYNSDSEVLWQSFDYPGNTILPGQTLLSGHKLVSNNFDFNHVLIMQNYGNLVLKRCSKSNNRRTLDVECSFVWESDTRKEGGHIVLNLDSTGRLSLVDRNGLVIKNLTKGEDRHQNCDCNSIIYRATLGSDGVFRLYRETIESDSGNSVELWHSYCILCRERERRDYIAVTILRVILGVPIIMIIVFLLAWIVDKFGLLPRWIQRCMYGN